MHSINYDIDFKSQNNKKGFGTKMKNVLIVFGTRPEAIKMCPVVKALESKSNINWSLES